MRSCYAIAKVLNRWPDQRLFPKLSLSNRHQFTKLGETDSSRINLSWCATRMDPWPSAILILYQGFPT